MLSALLVAVALAAPAVQQPAVHQPAAAAVTGPIRDLGILNPGYPVKVHQVTYAGPSGRINAYLVVPPGKGPFPAAIYLHGAGVTAASLLVPATWLAARGAIALLPETAFDRAGGAAPATAIGRLRRDRDLLRSAVAELRRAVDVLQALPSVDGRRIGLVGLSAGARLGAVLAGSEHRIAAYDLMSGGSAPPEAFVAAIPAADRTEALRILREIDPLRGVAHAAPSALFFQDGLQDREVPRAALKALAAAGSAPKRVSWYRAGHLLNDQAYRDQLAWLAARLRIAGPKVPGAATGP